MMISKCFEVPSYFQKRRSVSERLLIASGSLLILTILVIAFSYIFLVYSKIIIRVTRSLSILPHEVSSSRPFCCHGIECLTRGKGRYAILTTLRSDAYLPFLDNLLCSLEKSNPRIDIIVATKQGDLSASVESAVRNSLGANGKLLYWEDYTFNNNVHSRYALNWIKLRAWEMEEYDALLMIDSDTVILEDVQHLFTLPTHFAAAMDEDKVYHACCPSLGTLQGGVILLRPCSAVARHMQELLSAYPELRFTHDHAEQSFLSWYFYYDKLALPTEYNAISHHLRLSGGDVITTRMGLRPYIVHFTRKHVPQELKCRIP